MKCTSPLHLKDGSVRPCGQCRVCRFSRAREWAVRIVHELPYHAESCFVTLTYDPVALPEDGSLRKSEFQKFLKLLRYYLDGRKIRYYACGEYGALGRPHYHAVLFGVSLAEHRLGKRLRGSRSFECLAGPVVDAWKVNRHGLSLDGGFVAMGPVEYGCALYVAAYVRKKLTGAAASHYGDREPPFSCVSKGIGLQFALDHAEQIRENVFVSVNGKQVLPSRYYREKLGITADDVREARSERDTSEARELIKRYGERFPLLSRTHPLDAWLQAEDEAVQRDKNIAAEDRVRERYDFEALLYDRSGSAEGGEHRRF